MSHVRRRAALAVLLAVVIAALTSCTPPASPTQTVVSATEEAEVIAVVDGDTIDVSTSAGTARVRLIGIDMPEIGRDGEPGSATPPRLAVSWMIFSTAAPSSCRATARKPTPTSTVGCCATSSSTGRAQPSSRSRPAPGTNTPTTCRTSASSNTETPRMPRRPQAPACGPRAADQPQLTERARRRSSSARRAPTATRTRAGTPISTAMTRLTHVIVIAVECRPRALNVTPTRLRTSTAPSPAVSHRSTSRLENMR